MHCVVDSESLLMTCENDDQMLSVADTATTPQPSEPAETQILDEVTGSLCAVSSSSTSLQLPNPVDSFVATQVVHACVNTTTTLQPSERAGIGLQQILVAGSESLLMTCENDDQMLSVADTATTPQPSEAAETLILDEVTGLLCAVSSSSTSLQLPNPVDSFVATDVVVACVNTNGAEASVSSQCDNTDNATDAAQQPSTSSDQPVLDNDTDGNVDSVPRKRKRNEFNWLCNKRKRLRNSGVSYTNKKNKWCKGRSMKVLEGHDACRNKCSGLVSEDQRARLFSEFWKLGNFDVQNAFLSRSVRQHYVQRRRPRKTKKFPQSANSKKKNRKNFDKNYSRKYYVNVNGCDVSVCKEFFLATFDISSGRLNRAVAKQNVGGGVSPGDARGRYEHSKQRLPHDAVERVKTHISSFPAYVSHYTRAESQKKYLSSDLNVTKMHSLYEEQCTKDGVQPLKLWAYRYIFGKYFTLSFHHPVKDSCKRCDIFKAEIDNCSGNRKATLLRQHELHLRKAEKARSGLMSDSTNPDGTADVITFDLQKVMPVPLLSTNEAYYCRQLSVYNLGIHSLSKDQVIMNVWSEIVASRGADEIASCLAEYCRAISAKGVTHLIAYSDSCGGQNRNVKMVAMWMYITQTTAIEVVDHKFMVSGHSFLPNDTDFGLIERAKSKTSEIYVPEQWYAIIEKCCKKRPFTVNRMAADKFRSTKRILNAITNRKTSVDGQKVNWLQIQWIRVRKDKPLCMHVKDSLDEEFPFTVVSFAKRGRQRSLGKTKLPQLYAAQRPVSKEKHSDLRKLLKYIPPIHHDFYDHIKHSGHGNSEDVLEDECLEDSAEESETY